MCRLGCVRWCPCNRSGNICPWTTTIRQPGTSDLLFCRCLLGVKVSSRCWIVTMNAVKGKRGKFPGVVPHFMAIFYNVIWHCRLMTSQLLSRLRNTDEQYGRCSGLRLTCWSLSDEACSFGRGTAEWDKAFIRLSTSLLGGADEVFGCHAYAQKLLYRCKFLVQRKILTFSKNPSDLPSFYFALLTAMNNFWIELRLTNYDRFIAYRQLLTLPATFHISPWLWLSLRDPSCRYLWHHFNGKYLPMTEQ